MHLFSDLTLRNTTLKNRIVMSPMCQYSCEQQDGVATAWHLVHLGSRAIGGAAVVMMEATAVEARGRISPHDMGLWNDTQLAALKPIIAFIKDHGSLSAIQLAHAGRKASTYRPWAGRGYVPEHEGGWQPVAPSAVPFSEDAPIPHELSLTEIANIKQAFAHAAQRAVDAGFDIIEIHAAHGYLLHEFLSPLSNRRTDDYGGPLDNRARLLLEIASTLRTICGERPLWVRISATDWLEGGWHVSESVQLSQKLSALGVDLMDISSGGSAPRAPIPMGPGYQTTFAERIKRETGVPTGAIGMITQAAQADHIIRTQQADLVLIGRELLRDPYWPLHAAHELGHEVPWATQYERAKL